MTSLNDGLESCGLLMPYCDVFINCLDSHSDGTHSLKRILNGPKVSEFSANFHFWVNYFFNFALFNALIVK